MPVFPNPEREQEYQRLLHAALEHHPYDGN